MGKYLPSQYDRDIITAFAKTVRDAVLTFHKCPYDFVKKAIQTDLFLTFQEDFSLHSQSPNCIASEFLKITNVQNIDDIQYIGGDSDVGFWMGYLIMYWCIRDNFPVSIIKKINMEELYWNYDVYHTQDLDYVIRLLMEEL